MEYLDLDLLKDQINKNKTYQDFIDNAKGEVENYFDNFKDSPDHMSRWAHHYFCKEEGGLLIYNPETPEAHVCSICGKTYNNDLLNGVWFTMYRNQGATNAWKSGLLYRVTGDKKFLDYIIQFTNFYSDNYLNFKLHNKEGLEFENGEKLKWGCSRIMPQSLNEGIFLTRLVNALELVKEGLSDDLIAKWEKNLFNEAFELLKPQVHKVHNIPTWLNCTIGVMGFFLDNKDMIDFTFTNEFNILRQIEEGVTDDNFWYEGSIHYNCFLLEGVTNLLLFTALKEYDFSLGKKTVDSMLKAAYRYAFDSHQLPNPNDGWPDLNLKTYSYMYSMATKVLGRDSQVGKELGSILNQNSERGTIPLSRPYYYKNDISLEEVLFVPGLREENPEIIKTDSHNFKASYCAMIKADKSNLFLKYGHNGPSHAHPDKMTLELLLDGTCISRDLSNSGYGDPLCNEWYRMSPSHNTVVVNGEKQSGYEGGTCLIDEADRVKAEAKDVYPGVTYTRDVQLSSKGLKDLFTVTTPVDSTCDYFFHVEGTLDGSVSMSDASLGFSDKGYQHIKDVKKVAVESDEIELLWNVDGRKVKSVISVKNCELFIVKSPDNPGVNFRTTIVLRQKGTQAEFVVDWTIED